MAIQYKSCLSLCLIELYYFSSVYSTETWLVEKAVNCVACVAIRQVPGHSDIVTTRCASHAVLE